MPQPSIQESVPIGHQEMAEKILGQGQGQLPGQDPTLEIDPDYQRLFNFSNARINLKALIDLWSITLYTTEQNRAFRKLDLDNNVLQQQGKIDSDEMVIPTRTIDTNIKREQSVFIAYIQQARRIVTFTDRENPSNDTQVLEEDFSRGMTYEDWMTPHIKTIDGTQTHGWDCVEAVFDESKPLHVALEHIGHEKLIFPFDAREIQFLESIIRIYTVTQPQLRQFVKEFGFSNDQVKVILDKYSDTRKNESITIYKQLFKFQGVVYVSWFDITTTSDWLKAPEKLYLGRKEQVTVNVPILGQHPLTGEPTMDMVPTPQWQEQDETQYPVFMLPYENLEDERIVMNQGRVFLDKSKQEALTAIASGIVNGITRASQVYGSPAQGLGGRPMVNDDVQMTPGRLFTEKIEFWSTPWPDPSAMQAFQMLGTYNDAESGQVNYAAQNRQDSRKTAKEIEVASSEQGLLRSVQITNFSAWLRKVYSFCFQIVKSQALQGKIKFVSTRPDLLQADYDIRAAGDIDVIQRVEKLQRMKQDWPVIGTTPLAQAFLLDMIKISYPDEAPRYAQLLQQGSQERQWIASVMPVLPELMKQLPPGSIQPQEMQQLQQMYQQGQQIVSGQPPQSQGQPQ
jgi:hypothetical protein